MKSDEIASVNRREPAAATLREEPAAGSCVDPEPDANEGLLERVLERANRQRALQQVRRNRGAPVDSVKQDVRSCCLTKECYSRLGCRYRSSECQSPRVGFDFQIALSVFRGCGGRPPRPKHHREVRSLYHGNTTGSA